MSDIILSSGPSGIISNIDSVYILNKKMSIRFTNRH